MSNNNLTDEFLEKLAISRIYPLDRGYIIVGDDLVALARELQERRKADSAEPIYQYRIRNGYNGQVTEWQTIRRDQVDFVLKAQPLNAEFRIISAPQPAPVVPETLPCPVHLEPGLKFGKGVRTRCMLDALRRRAEYYAELEAMTPDQRAEHDAGIAEFKAMLGNDSRATMLNGSDE